MNQYRITFKHPPHLVGDTVVELSGSVLVAAETASAAREKFIRDIQRMLSLSIVSVCYVDVLDYAAKLAEC